MSLPNERPCYANGGGPPQLATGCVPTRLHGRCAFAMARYGAKSPHGASKPIHCEKLKNHVTPGQQPFLPTRRQRASDAAVTFSRHRYVVV